jgi:hypothetical protein
MTSSERAATALIAACLTAVLVLLVTAVMEALP